MHAVFGNNPTWCLQAGEDVEVLTNNTSQERKFPDLIFLEGRSGAGWLSQVIGDEKVSVKGLYELLVRRRLAIFKDLITPFRGQFDGSRATKT